MALLTLSVTKVTFNDDPFPAWRPFAQLVYDTSKNVTYTYQVLSTDTPGSEVITAGGGVIFPEPTSLLATGVATMVLMARRRVRRVER